MRFLFLFFFFGAFFQTAVNLFGEFHNILILQSQLLLASMLLISQKDLPFPFDFYTAGTAYCIC